MNKITTLAMFAISASTLLLAIAGYTIVTSAWAQTVMDNATMAGNMTGGNMTASTGNMSDAMGSISSKKK